MSPMMPTTADATASTGWAVLPPPDDRLFLKVCVEFALSTVSSAPRGFVVTAYPTQRIKQPEVLKWP